MILYFLIYNKNNIIKVYRQKLKAYFFIKIYCIYGCNRNSVLKPKNYFFGHSQNLLFVKMLYAIILYFNFTQNVCILW